MVVKRKVHILSKDNNKLQATIFEPEGVPKQVIIINSATGVRRQIYYRFADYLADLGAVVIIFDYRGIGDSKIRPLEQEPTQMADWALKDTQAIFDYVFSEYQNIPLSVLGHSFGGQIVGLIRGSENIKNLVLIGAQNGYWGYFPKWHWPFLIFLWKILIPASVWIFGYFPSSKIGLGEDLPPNVALQWAQWCCNPDYFFSEVSKSLPNYFNQVKAKTTAYIISDDFFAPDAAVLKLCERYPNAAMEAKLIAPRDLNVGKIGHFGIFKENMKINFWEVLAANLLNR
jgi:predicted alpha/beta hydrolase